MKVYFHLSLDGFSNCYIVGNEKTKEAIIIDPGRISNDVIHIIESNQFKLDAVLVTHNHKSHYSGLGTLRKIYDVRIFAADYEIAAQETTLLKGDGVLRLAGMNVAFMSVPGHSADSMVYKIGQILFTGDVMSAGLIGQTNNSYATRTLTSGILTKILSLDDNLTIMPGHGPPTSVEAEKLSNLSVGRPPAPDSPQKE